MQGGGSKGKPVLSKGYSSTQLVKAVLQFLSSRDLLKNPLLLHASSFKVSSVLGPMVFDGIRGINLLFKMSVWSYQMVKLVP